jgi:hypothetical protein
MVERTHGKLNWVEKNLPEGLLVDSAWLARHGYSTALRSHYLSAGWLEQPARRVYRRPRGELTWQQVVISLQTLLDSPLAVGGRTALELQGYAHYLAHTRREVHLYGPKHPPGWVSKLRLHLRFVYHNDARLFRKETVASAFSRIDRSLAKGGGRPSFVGSLAVQPWGQWNWPLILSAPERAVLELLDELPTRESFHQVDQLMEGLSNLSPRRLQVLLADCRSVKVKRLFFFFADRHPHAWLKRLDKSVIDLGKGKRLLAKGGKLDRTYQITVPEDLDGVR